VARRALDLPSFVGGVVILVIGAVLLLDRLDVITLHFASFGPLCCAAIGAVLLATGLSRRD
jgi:hypothetical protein